MRNLAGVEASEATTVATLELTTAGIQTVPLTPTGEVHATVGGVIEVGGYEIRLDRRWVYWGAQVVRMPNQPEDRGPRLPGPLAVALNDAPHSNNDGTRYSGSGRGLGAVVRADGYAGGQASSDLVEDGVRGWHIDTQDGLNAFAQWCRDNLKA